MSAQDDFTRVFIWVLGLLVFFTIVIALVARSIGLDENSGPMSDRDIDKRTMPYGSVKVADAKAVSERPMPVSAADKATASEAATATSPVSTN